MEKLIEEKLGQFKKRGSEILVKTCPFCGSSKYKFSINPNKGVFKCWSGSCQESGHVNRLFPGKVITLEPKKTVESNISDLKHMRVIDKLEVKVLPKESIGLTYELEKRGISRMTAMKMKILVNKKNNALFIPLQEKEGELVGVKYRTADKKIWAEANSKLVLFNYLQVKNCDDIIITEGEIDCLTLSEIGIENVCSVPSGTNNFDWIEYHWEFLKSRNSITLAFDNDEAGHKAFFEASKRLGYSKIKTIDLKQHNDINDFFLEEGSIDTFEMIQNSKMMEIPNVVEGSEIIADDGEVEAISFGCGVLDKMMSGMKYNEVTVWSGTPGSGKSTLVNNFTANLLEQDEKVFVYSGEFSCTKYKRWLLNIICKKEKLIVKTNKFNNEELAFCPKGEELKINNMLKDRLYIYDSNSTAQETELLDVMLEVRNRYNVRVFVLDNLMTVNLNGAEENKWDNQKYFIQKLHEFAVQNNVAVHLVAHPKKLEKHKLDDYSMYDISGSSDIPNLVDNIVFLKRLDEKEMNEVYNRTGMQPTVGAILAKDRENGRIGKKGMWKYNQLSRRFIDMRNENKTYNYENSVNKNMVAKFPF